MEKFISHFGKKIHYRISGNGNTLVLLHGYLESIAMWKAHQEALSTSFQVISIDLPGHGLTDYFAKTHGMTLMADIVYQVLTAENIEECVMIGHSMGGYVSLAFADKYPQLLKGFGLFHSHATDDDAQTKLNRERTIDLINLDKGHYIYHFIPTLYAPANEPKFAKEIEGQITIANAMTKENVIAAMAGMKERNSSLDVLIDAKVPVLFILGKQDSRIPLEKALAQASLPTTSQLLILGESGHMGWIEEPKKTIQAIKGFLELCFN